MPGMSHPAFACRFSVRTGRVTTEVRVRGHETFARAIGAVTAAVVHATRGSAPVLVEFPDAVRGELVRFKVAEDTEISTDQPVLRPSEVAQAVSAWTITLSLKRRTSVTVDHRWLAPGQESLPDVPLPPRRSRHLRILPGGRRTEAHSADAAAGPAPAEQPRERVVGEDPGTDVPPSAAPPTEDAG